MTASQRRARVAVVATAGRLGLALGARLAAVLARQDFELVSQGDDTDLRRKVPDGLWPLEDTGPSAVIHGPQRKGRGGKIKRW